MDLQQLEKAAAVCTECELHKGRIKPVFAKGNPNSEIMICGMVPAWDENRSGIPFVGRAGQLLDIILEQVGFTLNDIYITNICKCFLAPGNPLKQQWMDTCLPYLLIQIDIIKPKVILVLGADASNALVVRNDEKKQAIGRMRGRVYQFGEALIVPTYHPSYLIRGGGQQSPGYNNVINDFLLAKSILEKDAINEV
jgi:DNA polymerase